MPDERRPFRVARNAAPGPWRTSNQQSIDPFAPGLVRNDIVTGVDGKQIMLDDAAGNPIELSQSVL